jgi:hypothetical protein
MFQKLSRLIGSLALVVTGLTACNRMQAPSDRQNALLDDVRYSPRAYRTHMADNATLHDMSVVDFHFVPHTSELSGTGVARLERMAALLDAYGGTVRYETSLADDDLIALRLDHVREYLSLAGCNMSRVEVRTGLSGGRGMAASDALRGYDGMITPQQEQQGGSPSGLPLMGGPAGQGGQ